MAINRGEACSSSHRQSYHHSSLSPCNERTIAPSPNLVPHTEGFSPFLDSCSTGRTSIAMADPDPDPDPDSELMRNYVKLCEIM
jgi:hypothetical protein